MEITVDNGGDETIHQEKEDKGLNVLDEGVKKHQLKYHHVCIKREKTRMGF